MSKLYPYLHYLKPVVEIVFLWFVFYNILNFIRGTRALHVLKALVFLLVIFIIAQRLRLETITWILNKLFAISVMAILIIFQPELRRGLMRLGAGHLLGVFIHEEKNWEELLRAVINLSQKKIGCLIAIQKEIGFKPYIESAVAMDSLISEELIEAVFKPGGPLHDGGMIIEGTRISAAGCLFPLTSNPHVSKTLGTRHRAALGLTEESDCLAIVVSEENGLISLAQKGVLRRDVDEETLHKILEELYRPRVKKRLFGHNRH